MRLAAPEVFLAELPQGRRPLLLLDVFGGVSARADAMEGVAGAAAGLRQFHLAVAGDDDAPAAPLDARLYDPDLLARGMDAEAEAGQLPAE